MRRDIKSYNKRLQSLKSERSSFMSHWKELSDNLLAHRGQFLSSNRNKGHKRNTNQINNISRRAIRTLASGMMAGITSPARPWFRLMTPDPLLNDIAAVKEWLFDVENMMREVFSASNTYNSLHLIYSELATFGTAALGVYENFDNVIWCRPYTVGAYMLATNEMNQVDTFYREYERTVAQVIKEFGEANVSDHVRDLWKKGSTEAWVKIVHVIEPNDDRDNKSPFAGNKKYRSVYYESEAKHRKGDKGDKGDTKFLRESGFDSFPIMAPRWEGGPDDVYGTDCPGMMAIGDNKSLQIAERRGYQALDKVANPPVQAPGSLRNKVSSILPGEVVYVDDTSAGGLRNIYDYRPDLNAIDAKIVRVEDRIDKTFYVDLFLMLSNTTRRQITAREIVERHEEKLLMLGPVLERLHNELLDPLIDRTFSIMQKAGVLPEPPEELQGMDLKVEYVSVLAQAQKMVAVGAIERVASFAGELSAVWADARHKFDAQQAIDEYSESLGLSPRIVRSDDDVAEIVAQEQEAMQRQKATEMAAQGVNMAKVASETNTESQNALTDMMKMAGVQQ